jgi:hypothetical protein
LVDLDVDGAKILINDFDDDDVDSSLRVFGGAL